ncbi:MAG: hypothetical protein IPP52_09085 [Ignavibacteria bacterium]|nr:hypothetical protein [Ignavibacteria bacterium]
MTKDQRPNQYYTLINPVTKKEYKPNPDRVWGYIPETMKSLIEENRVFFPEDITKRPMMKRFKENLKSEINPYSSWINDIGMNSEATRKIREIFENNFFHIQNRFP